MHRWIWLVLAAALAVVGCGGSSSGGSGGSGGSGASGGVSGANEDAQLTYEGEPLLLDTVNSCLFGTDGADTVLTATIASEQDAPNQVLITFGSLVELLPGTGPSETISMGGSLMDLELIVIGQLDLVDFDPDRAQILMEGTCTVDFVFDRTLQLGSATSIDAYTVDFECPSITYQWLNSATSMLEGAGTLTDFSGSFPCFMSEFL